jgi:hypothetical protein
VLRRRGGNGHQAGTQFLAGRPSVTVMTVYTSLTWARDTRYSSHGGLACMTESNETDELVGAPTLSIRSQKWGWCGLVFAEFTK